LERLPWQTRMLLGLLGKEHDNPPMFPRGVPDVSHIDHARYRYYALAAYVDYEVGRMLDFLDRELLTPSTLVAFWSDHGSQLFDHGIGNDKHTFYDASLRIPFLLRWPGVLPANATATFASTLDLTATTAAAAGQTPPPDWQGFDLVAALRHGDPSPRTVAVSVEYRSFALVTPRWKLAYFPEQGEGRLFDRIADPDERTDLFESTAHAAPRDGLLRALLRWRAQQDPIGYLQWNSKRSASSDDGGDALEEDAEAAVVPVQGRVQVEATNHTDHLLGLDAEVRLQHDALPFDRM